MSRQRHQVRDRRDKKALVSIETRAVGDVAKLLSSGITRLALGSHQVDCSDRAAAAEVHHHFADIGLVNLD